MEFKDLIVLVVEDNAVAQKVMERFLDKVGCDYHSVDNAKDALDLGKNYAFDIAFIDLMIPEMPGTLIGQKIKEMRPETNLVAMTAFVESYTREDCINHGFDELLTKPLTLDIIKETIKKTITEKDKDISQEQIDQVMKYFDNDIDFLDNSFRLILKHFPDKVAELETAINDKDLQDLTRKAHAIKNSLIYFGQSGALDAVIEIEKASRAGEEINYHYPLNTLKQEFASLRAKIELIKESIHKQNISEGTMEIDEKKIVF